MATVNTGRGYVYAIQYHFVFCIKYRHEILIGEVEANLKELLYEIANDYDFTIEEMETDKDHVHLLVNCNPQHRIPDMVKCLKGISARKLFQKNPEIKKELWGGALWNPSYFVATVSEQTEEQIREYIKNQQTKPRKRGGQRK